MKRKIILIISSLLAAIIIALVLIPVITPVPMSLIMRMFFESPQLDPPEGYDEMSAAVTVLNDLEYPSLHPDNTFDLYLPTGEEEPRPVILWVHGGAYVGGDKRDARYYSTALASEGYAVVSMNYRRAPEGKYPVPIVQMGELCAWLCELSGEYNLDMTRLVLAGDSAGAHSAATFALIHTNPAYAEESGLAATLPAETIKGVLLYCGPFDVGMTGKTEGIFGFMILQAGWAYFGTRNWAEEYSDIAAPGNYVTADYPPAFITDGNTASFEPQGKKFAGELEAAGAPVTSYFIPLETEKTIHEYQFMMNTPSGRECYRRTLLFLEQYLR